VSPTVNEALVLPVPADPLGEERAELAAQLVELARAEGVSSIGPGAMLTDLTKRVPEAGFEIEVTEHLGHEKHAEEGRGDGKAHNGTRQDGADRDRPGEHRGAPGSARHVRAAAGAQVATPPRGPRRDGEVAVRPGMITGDMEAHLAEVYETRVSRETISQITEDIIEKMDGGLAGVALDRIYRVVFIDAIHVKFRNGLVAIRAFYIAIGVTVNGTRDILGIWASSGAEGTKFS
jgi:putative transposase